MAKPILPNLLEHAITLRLAGHTLSSITDRTGLSASTLYRYFRQYAVKRSQVKVDCVLAAREQLINDTSLIDNLKPRIASSIDDDLALSRQIRDAIARCLEELLTESRTPTAVKCRSLAALSTSLRLTQEVQRRALNMDINPHQNQFQELTTLTVVKMSDSDVKAAQSALEDDDYEYEDASLITAD
jgi:AcrR family transcriptional regulator